VALLTGNNEKAINHYLRGEMFYFFCIVIFLGTIPPCIFQGETKSPGEIMALGSSE
jgi:hypothetical protein